MAFARTRPPNAPLYLAFASRGRHTAAVSILRFDNDPFNAFNFQIFTQVGFLWSIPAVHLGQYLDRANFVGRTRIPVSDWQVADFEPLFRGPLDVGSNLLLDFFRRTLQLGDNLLDALAAPHAPRIGRDRWTLRTSSDGRRMPGNRSSFG